jgi:hypothetical protein
MTTTPHAHRRLQYRRARIGNSREPAIQTGEKNSSFSRRLARKDFGSWWQDNRLVKGWMHGNGTGAPWPALSASRGSRAVSRFRQSGCACRDGGQGRLRSMRDAAQCAARQTNPGLKSVQPLRCRILLRLRRFLRPSFLRPLPLFLTPIPVVSPLNLFRLWSMAITI